jgi:hypothetical protein
MFLKEQVRVGVLVQRSIASRKGKNAGPWRGFDRWRRVFLLSCGIYWPGKAATSSLFLIPAGENL